ncbi:MAG TPA: peptidyl-prolyl cis-trans isomerase, partial [Anaeromyxobacter sp.]
DDVVDGQDLKGEFVRRHGGHQRFLSSDEYIVRKFLDATIDRRLLLQEAYRLGLQDAPDIAEAVAELQQRKQAEELVRAEVKDKVAVSDAEVQAVYDARTEDLYLVRQIVTATRAEAEAIRAELAAGADFEAVARDRSLADSRKFGGLVPEVAWGARAPEWEEAVFALEPKQVAGPFEAADGFELVRLESRRKAEKPDLAQAQPRIRAILQQRKLEARRREVVGELRARHAVKLADFDRRVEALRAAREAKDPRPVATWTEGKLGLGELAQALDLDKLARLPPERQPKAVDAEVEAAVNERVVKAEAATRGYEALPEIARAVRDYREGLMENRLYGAHVFREVVVTDADVEAYYQAHAAEFLLPERRHVAHVVLASREAAEEVKQLLAGGAPFEEIVKTRSKDPEAAKTGGDLGWIEKKEAPGDLAAIFDAKAGALAGPVETKFGFHVLKVLEIAPARTPPLEEVAADARKKATRVKNQERRDAWVKQLREAASIRVSERAVLAFVEEGRKEAERAGAMKAPPSHDPMGGGPKGPPPGHGGAGGSGAPLAAPAGHPEAAAKEPLSGAPASRAEKSN